MLSRRQWSCSRTVRCSMRAAARCSTPLATTSSTRLSWTVRPCVRAPLPACAATRNPVLAARAVMEKTRHVLLCGDGADRFAAEIGLAVVPHDYYSTEARHLALKRVQRTDREKHDAVSAADRHGTVGAVALDAAGNLAAATSTGGFTNKMPGRVGDSPVIGAGTYADNATCAVSGTGSGEHFMRAVLAHTVSARMRYRDERLPLPAATRCGKSQNWAARAGSSRSIVGAASRCPSTPKACIVGT